jgi:DNA-binding response OmpR family regulator
MRSDHVWVDEEGDDADFEQVDPEAKALVIDPDPLSRSELGAVLRQHFYLVFAGSAPTALAALERHRFALVVCSHALGPGHHGDEILRRVRRESPGSVRALLTGGPSRYPYPAGTDADLVLAKPFDARVLVSAVLRHVRARPAAANARSGSRAQGRGVNPS